MNSIKTHRNFISSYAILCDIINGELYPIFFSSLFVIKNQFTFERTVIGPRTRLSQDAHKRFDQITCKVTINYLHYILERFTFAKVLQPCVRC